MVLIRSALTKHIFCGEIRKIPMLYSWKSALSGVLSHIYEEVVGMYSSTLLQAALWSLCRHNWPLYQLCPNTSVVAKCTTSFKILLGSKQKKHVTKVHVLLMTTHNIHFWAEIRKSIFWILLVSGLQTTQTCKWIWAFAVCLSLKETYCNDPKGLSKLCRPRSDAAGCSIWSGSTLFATHPAIF